MTSGSNRWSLVSDIVEPFRKNMLRPRGCEHDSDYHRIDGSPPVIELECRITRLCHLILIAAVGVAVAGIAHAGVTDAASVQCERAIGTAARAHGVPIQLASAIGLVETGRHDQVSGVLRPWPWAINAEGKTQFFNSKPEAVAAVRSLQASGVRSIDVGCMQVNLLHHPNAFSTLEEAFDPQRNANYAELFLGQLFRQSGNWLTAAGWYHSTTAALAADYVRKMTAFSIGGLRNLGGSPASSNMPNAIKDTKPILDRSGMILPSVRLTSAKLVPTRALLREVGTSAGRRLAHGAPPG